MKNNQVMRITKQSLVDWQVLINDIHHAWIRKESLGYRVTLKEFPNDKIGFWSQSFKEAKYYAST